jgi:hypothetical protein
MPNGGVPIHLVMDLDEGSGAVLHCKGDDVRIFERAYWELIHADGTPIVSLSRGEPLVLARFPNYWIDDPESRPVLYRHAASRSGSTSSALPSSESQVSTREFDAQSDLLEQ